MAQKSIELILFRQLTSYLNIPAFIIDHTQKVVFCNAQAESVIGFQFSEALEMSIEEWSAIFSIQATNGYIVDLKDSSIYKAYKTHKITFDIYHIQDPNDYLLKVGVYTIPILGQLQNFHGVVVFFQEIA